MEAATRRLWTGLQLKEPGLADWNDLSQAFSDSDDLLEKSDELPSLFSGSSGLAEDGLEAAAVAYGTLVNDVLELKDATEVDEVVSEWQEQLEQNPQVAQTQELLLDMAQATRKLMSNRPNFSKSKLKAMFEDAWEQKLESGSPKDRTPWTNCEILYRRPCFCIRFHPFSSFFNLQWFSIVFEGFSRPAQGRGALKPVRGDRESIQEAEDERLAYEEGACEGGRSLVPQDSALRPLEEHERMFGKRFKGVLKEI